MEMRIFMTGWKKNYKSTITMIRDTPEIRLKLLRKACKLFIFIAANVTPSNSLIVPQFIYQHVVSTHHGPNKMNRVCTKGMFLFQLDKHQAASFLSSNSLWDNISIVSQICKYNSIQYYSYTHCGRLWVRKLIRPPKRSQITSPISDV